MHRNLHLAFAALLVWSLALLGVRMIYSHSFWFLFLIWNLFLAVIPYVAAVAFERTRRVVLQACAFVVWILFLPNAPYLVTDFIHLRPHAAIPLWYDVLLLMSCAGTGLLLGYASVLLVQNVIARKHGARAGWCVAVVALVLSAYGIYLGRFLRFNSWEALTDPLPLFADIAHQLTNPLSHPKTFAVTLLFGVTLTLGYFALHAFAPGVPRQRFSDRR
ncbi:MAG: DUF1361 domain-containing protein [Acidobacteria bacterium]|nr:DUF1361 domain-containing protein [Acidobacteriota bacterium]MBV9478712.1 DUF1361 domain-containing protein [Acidobacteriota bacterium]